jgi:hypothetical protein
MIAMIVDGGLRVMMMLLLLLLLLLGERNERAAGLRDMLSRRMTTCRRG